MIVAWTLEQVFWAPVHVQVYTLYRCLFDINVHICDTLAAGVHIYVYGCIGAHACIFIWMRISSMIFLDTLRRCCWDFIVYDISWHVEASLLRFPVCGWVCMYKYMYMCAHVCVYMCMCICMYMYICVSVYMYAYTCIYPRVWLYICTGVGAFCLFVLSNPFATCICIAGFFQDLHAVCGGDWNLCFFPVCSMFAFFCWRGSLFFGRGRDRGFVRYISLFWRVLRWFFWRKSPVQFCVEEKIVFFVGCPHPHFSSKLGVVYCLGTMLWDFYEMWLSSTVSGWRNCVYWAR